MGANCCRQEPEVHGQLSRAMPSKLAAESKEQYQPIIPGSKPRTNKADKLETVVAFQESKNHSQLVTQPTSAEDLFRSHEENPFVAGDEGSEMPRPEHLSPDVERTPSTPPPLIQRRISRKITVADVVEMALYQGKALQNRQPSHEPTIRLASDLKKNLHVESTYSQQAKKNREKVCFDSTECDLVAAFQNVDRDRDGKVSIFDLVRELRRTNPLASKQEILTYQQFMELIMPVYSKEKKLFWTFSEFQRFMHDSALLERGELKM